MKKNLTPLALLIAATLMVFVLGCDSNGSNPLSEQALGTVTGSIQLSPNLQGSTAQTHIAIYKSTEDYFARKAWASVMADENGNYVIQGVAPGQYYIDAWKDNDGNGGITKGDFYSVHCDAEGHMCNCCCAPGKTMCTSWMLNIVQ